jgi:hypothetical protein
MRNWNWATKFIFCSSAAIALAACGSSSDSTTSNVGGAGSTGGNAAAGGQGTGVTASDTGGAIATAGGGQATGGAIATAGGGQATGGAVATTGGSKSTGGTSATSATGGLAATGGAASTTVAATMCDNVCDLLSTRTPPLDCAPTDRVVCVTTCNSTFTKLAGARTTCSDAYVALYQCGLTQPASSWTCFVYGTISIPIPPNDVATCGTQYDTLISILATTPSCVQALKS